MNLLKEKWMFVALRFETALKENKSKGGFIVGAFNAAFDNPYSHFLPYSNCLAVCHLLSLFVGSQMTYADILGAFPLVLLRCVEVLIHSHILRSCAYFDLGDRGVRVGCGGVLPSARGPTDQGA